MSEIIEKIRTWTSLFQRKQLLATLRGQDKSSHYHLSDLLFLLARIIIF